jgi:hypothetical protein
MILRVLTWPFRAVRDWMKRDVEAYMRNWNARHRGD